MCLRLCCDPHKLTYISAIVTICEAVLFGALNLTLILLSKCVIQPPEKPLGAGLDEFYSYYFFSNTSCFDRYGQNYTIPYWISYDYPISPRPEVTSVEANLSYQIAYLALHGAWVLSSLLLLYGNARKLWGFYIPWLLICFTFAIMDTTIAAFFIIDMMNVIEGDAHTSGGNDVAPMIWSFSMYLRIYFFWFSNLGHMATGLNAFCKTRHKRAKQERKKKKMEKKHQRELAEAKTKAAAEARAAATVEAQAETIQLAQNHPTAESHQYSAVTDDQGIPNMAYQDGYSYQPEPHAPPYPAPAPVPKEVRPFSYLNPSFRPNDPHDVVGMKAHPSPNLVGAIGTPKGQGYFSAIPPADYDDDFQPLSQASLPRVNLNNSASPLSQAAPRDVQPDYNRQQNSGYYY